jgi:chromate transporter
LGTWLQERPEIMAAIAVFVPPYLIVIAGAPYYRRLTKKLASEGVRSGRDGGSGGAIAGAAPILGRRSLIDLQTVSIALTTFGLLNFKKIPVPFLILAAGMVGPLLFKG